MSHAPVYLEILAGLVVYTLVVLVLCWLPQMRERRRRGRGNTGEYRGI